MPKLNLITKKCVACKVGIPPMKDDLANQMLFETPGWVRDGNLIKRDFTFKDFKESMAFINKVAALAESEGHHPDIYVFFNKVTLKLMTHYANGLTENDFILAAKVKEVI
jgi:4a-hydroxytetrahydrobiopterin dehydratase